MDILNWRELTPSTYCSGQPCDTDWKELAGKGVKTVLNLCPPTQAADPEKQLVEAQGMEYHNIPVAGPGDLTDEAVNQFRQLVKEKGQGLLVHCASGNRVGALFALAAHADGKSVEEAMQLGVDAGLTGLAPFVEAKLRGA